jgi:hypothetical protein
VAKLKSIRALTALSAIWDYQMFQEFCYKYCSKE